MEFVKNQFHQKGESLTETFVCHLLNLSNFYKRCQEKHLFLIFQKQHFMTKVGTLLLGCMQNILSFLSKR